MARKASSTTPEINHGYKDRDTVKQDRQAKEEKGKCDSRRRSCERMKINRSEIVQEEREQE